MKATFICLVLFVAAVSSQKCNFAHHECSSVVCSAGLPHCVFGWCTCTLNEGKACHVKSDCDGHCLHNRPQHCIDEECHCALESGIGGIDGGHD